MRRGRWARKLPRRACPSRWGRAHDRPGGTRAPGRRGDRGHRHLALGPRVGHLGPADPAQPQVVPGRAAAGASAGEGLAHAQPEHRPGPHSLRPAAAARAERRGTHRVRVDRAARARQPERMDLPGRDQPEHQPRAVQAGARAPAPAQPAHREGTVTAALRGPLARPFWALLGLITAVGLVARVAYILLIARHITVQGDALTFHLPATYL